MTPDEVFAPETEDRSFARDKMVRDWLRKPFRPNEIGRLPATAKRPALDFVGHAAVTDRLNRIAPDWSYTIDDEVQIRSQEVNSKTGETRDIVTYWIRGTMTVGGVSRPEYGDGNDPKEAIGNFIRRGAMRFGVALDLWSQQELTDSAASSPPRERAADAPGPRPAEATASPSATGPGGTTSEGGGGRKGKAAPAPPDAKAGWPKDRESCPHMGGTVMGTDKVERCRDCGMAYAEYAA